MNYRRAIVIVAVFLLSAPALLLRADTIELVNGDVINGEVVSLNDKEVKVKSDVLGELSINREKVIGISFGDAKSRRARVAPAAPARNIKTPASNSTADAVLKELRSKGIDPAKLNETFSKLGISVPSIKSPDRSAGNEDVIKQLRTKGIDKRTVDELKVKIPLLNLPGVKGYFNDTLGGLVSGKLDVQDIRKDAVKARDQLMDIKKDLGPSGAALDGYLRILNGFIEETEPEKPVAPNAESDELNNKRGRT